MIALYDTFIRFRNGSGYFVKLLADGLMAVVELPQERKAMLVVEMLDHADKLVRSVQSVIKHLNYPRPDGFRIRVAAGDVLKLEASHPLDKTKIQVDYSEYAVDIAFGLLGVEKDSPCICHETVREIVESDSEARALVKFEKVKRPAVCPEGIDPEDLDALWSYRILK
jgi:class 3 adenylate cyclase